MIESGEDVSRRNVLKAGAGIGAAGLLSGLAGCSTVQDVVLGGGDVDAVPEDAESVYTVNAAAVMEDDGVETLTDAYLELRSESEWYEGPESYEEILETFEDEIGLDPAKADSITGFSEYSNYGVTSEYSGTIFSGDWEQDDVVDAYEDTIEGTGDDEYGGQTVYVPEHPEHQPTLGILGDDRYVVGNQAAVEDVIDVENGEEDGLDEELKESYDATRDAPVRYAGEMPSWIESEEIEQNGQTITTAPIQNVDYVSGAVYKSGEDRGLETTLHADDEGTAEDVVDVLQGALAMVENDEYTDEVVKDEADEVAVEQDAATAVVRYEKSVDELEDLMEEMSRA